MPFDDAGFRQRVLTDQESSDLAVLIQVRECVRKHWRKGSTRADKFGNRCILGWIEVKSADRRQRNRIVQQYVAPKVPINSHRWFPGACVALYNDHPLRSNMEMVWLCDRAIATLA